MEVCYNCGGQMKPKGKRLVCEHSCGYYYSPLTGKEVITYLRRINPEFVTESSVISVLHKIKGTRREALK